MIPELILSIGSLVALLIGLFIDHKSKFSLYFIIVISIFAIAAIPQISSFDAIEVFNGFLLTKNNQLSTIYIIGCLIFSLLITLLNHDEHFEIPIILSLGTLGLIFITIATNLIVIYTAIELFSIASYVAIASYKHDNSIEAVIKYFIFNITIATIFVFGCTFIFHSTNSFDILQIASYVNDNKLSLEFISGLICIIVTLMFKLSVFPFHMWSPDVYQGSNTNITAFMSGGSKIAFVNLLQQFLYYNIPYITEILILFGTISIFVGTFAAIRQKNLKRIISYSSISNVGYVISFLAVTKDYNIALLYIVVYVIFNLYPIWFIISIWEKQLGKAQILLENIVAYSKRNRFISGCTIFVTFSMIGLPPFPGFIIKTLLIIRLINCNVIYLAVLFILSSIISSFYYLRILKNIYFTCNNDIKHYNKLT